MTAMTSRSLTQRTSTLVVEIKSGDKVRYASNGSYPSWDGAEGIVLEVHSSLASVKLTTPVKDFPAGSIVGLTRAFLYIKGEEAPKEDALPFAQGGFTSAVNHPAHYGGGDNPYEVIKVAEAWGLDKDAYLFNVLKYIARAGKKEASKELEDLKKGRFYIDRRITEREAAKL
jgi:hypothetical protein